LEWKEVEEVSHVLAWALSVEVGVRERSCQKGWVAA